MWLLLVTAVFSVVGVMMVRVEHPAAGPTVNDVSQINPIQVAEILVPTTTEEIVAAVKSHAGPIAVGGARHSMGGQIGTRGALHIDMRRFNRILAFDPVQKTITVQAGARWRQIQARIDSAGLAIKIMQTYANFTVGGSVSVNVHGRYVGLGPMILSIRSLHVVLADGRLVEASRTVNPDIFFGVVGGYGALGVITDVTLDLADNIRVKRHNVRMPITAYRAWFLANVRNSPTAVFHNGDIYPDDYAQVNAVTYDATTESVTVRDRLIPEHQSYARNRAILRVISEWPFGKTIRQRLVDPWLFRDEPVEWRNYEASYDADELEPASHEASTYVLQEYFAPVERFDEFVPKLRAVFQRHHVNVINVSIRHALPDPGSLLSWARSESYAFVVWYKQGLTEAARESVGVWTREMTDSVLSVGGSYYLPYQPHATRAQFLRAYPRAPEFFALKARLDPTTKFRNTLWDHYYRAPGDSSPPELMPAELAQVRSRPGYRRDEGQTFLTHPEWYIVYSPEEYAAFMRDSLPTNFPYVRAIGQFWIHYFEMNAITRQRYPFNTGYHFMLMVIGTSYSVELTIKALYENTIGRFSGWTAGHQLTAEDHFAWQVAAHYGRFIHVRPWYEYHFWPKLTMLWARVSWRGPHPIRKWERRLFLSIEYGVKAFYATVIEAGTHLAYEPEDDRMQLIATGNVDSIAAADPRIKMLAPLGPGRALLSLPRYDVFRDVILQLGASGARLAIDEIAGNDEILLTGIAPAAWRYQGTDAVVVNALPVVSNSTTKRVTMYAPVGRLLPLVRALAAEGQLRIDHIYDY